MTPRRPLTQTMTSSMTSSVEHNGVKSLRKRKFDSTKDDDDDDSVSQENDSAEEIVTSVKETESSKTNIFTYLKSLFLTKDKEKFGNSKPTLINSWRLHCSVLLPIGTVVFFIILGLLYVTMRSDNSTHEERLLDAATQTSSQSDSTMEVMGVVNSIYEVLSKAAGEKICNYTQNSDILKVKEMKILLKVKEQIFYEALDLIRANPDWKLMLYKDADSSLIGGDDSIRDVVSMSSLQPFIPTLCRFWRAVEKVLFRVTVVVLGDSRVVGYHPPAIQSSKVE
uniref:Uncharacterized protein n=1 Tax=Ciona savignyi TaxID=51511 RepID=H2YT95_CIOSA